MGLVEGDLTGYHRLTADDGRIRFATDQGGPVLQLRSRVERRFLGRTEIAVFETDYDLPVPDPFLVELRHTGRVKRSGVTAAAGDGHRVSARVAEALAADPELIRTALPLDFTHFEVHGGPDGCIARTELMGASLVAIALPPMRSYVRLYPDQLSALAGTLSRIDSVLQGVDDWYR